MNFKKLIVTASTVSLLIISAAVAGAQDTTNTDEPTAQLTQRGSGLGQRGGNGEMRALLEQYTGLEGQELKSALRDGATAAELIEANGESVEAYIDAAVDLAEQRIDAAVETDRLTEEEAAEALSNTEARITERVNGTFERGEGKGRGPRGNGEGRGPRGGAPDVDVTEEADA